MGRGYMGGIQRGRGYLTLIFGSKDMYTALLLPGLFSTRPPKVGRRT